MYVWFLCLHDFIADAFFYCLTTISSPKCYTNNLFPWRTWNRLLIQNLYCKCRWITRNKLLFISCFIFLLLYLLCVYVQQLCCLLVGCVCSHVCACVSACNLFLFYCARTIEGVCACAYVLLCTCALYVWLHCVMIYIFFVYQAKKIVEHNRKYERLHEEKERKRKMYGYLLIAILNYVV